MSLYHKPPSSNYLLKAKSLCKSYYQPLQIELLRSIDLTVLGGESVAIVGRSGEGKSTLLQILGTLEDPCSGSLEIAGTLVCSSNKSFIRNQLIGFVFQSFHLLEDYTALENVLMPLMIRGDNFKYSEKKAEKILKEVIG